MKYYVAPILISVILNHHFDLLNAIHVKDIIPVFLLDSAHFNHLKKHVDQIIVICC